MNRLPFVDKLKVVIDGLGGACQRIQYDALRFLTGPYLGEDRARLERTCELLRGFVGTVDGRTVLTLGSIRECLRDPYLDPSKIIETFPAGGYAGGRFVLEHRHWKDRLDKHAQFNTSQGMPIAGLGPRNGAEAYCYDRIGRALDAFANWIRSCASVELARYENDHLEPLQREYYLKRAEYIGDLCRTDSTNPTAEMPEYDGPWGRRFEVSGDFLRVDWLVDQGMAEHAGELMETDFIESVYLDVAKIAADPMCGAVGVGVLSNDKALEVAAPHPEGDRKRRRRQYKPSQFPVVDGASISDLTIRFATGDTIDCRVRDVHRNYTFDEAGFANRRVAGPRLPVALWEFFAKLAELNGELAYNKEQCDLITALNSGPASDGIEEDGASFRGIDPNGRYIRDAAHVGFAVYENIKNVVSDLREKLRLLFPQFSNQMFIRYTKLEKPPALPGVAKQPLIYGFKTQFQLRQTYSE